MLRRAEGEGRGVLQVRRGGEQLRAARFYNARDFVVGIGRAYDDGGMDNCGPECWRRAGGEDGVMIKRALWHGILCDFGCRVGLTCLGDEVNTSVKKYT